MQNRGAHTHCTPNQEAIQMIVDPTPDAKTFARFAEPPWNEHAERWRELDEKLPCDHLAREIRDAMPHLDLAPLYRT